jgi:hypothetical protein
MKSAARFIGPGQQRRCEESADGEHDIGISGERPSDSFAPLRAGAGAVKSVAFGRADKGRFGRAERDFNILFLSTGELSLTEFLPNARQGQLVRLVDIPGRWAVVTAKITKLHF